MDYIQQLRQKVGHAPIILIGATVLILNEQNELLMLLRSDNGCWGVPGGAMEPGERLEDTAIRETLEETSLQIEELTLFDVFSGCELYYQYPNGDEVYNVSIVYTASQVVGELKIDLEEHSKWKYFPLDKLPDNVSPPIKIILEKFKNKRL
jgi:8-oxo-dGTP pyrophosphatase MutT (NUDIX family)